jgi:hypothetical protein
MMDYRGRILFRPGNVRDVGKGGIQGNPVHPTFSCYGIVSGIKP